MKLDQHTTAKYLKNLNIQRLNPMQEAVLSAAPNDNDIVLLSPTGSGKTLAFLLAILQQLEQEPARTQALVLTPSRELALQIDQVFRKLQTGFVISCCYGGHSIKIELKNLEQAPTIIVGTPGRIADHLRRMSFDPSTIHTLVLDEFDKSLELGFAKEMSFILEQLPNISKQLLTSATYSIDLPDFISLNAPKAINFLDEKTDEQLQTKAIVTKHEERIETLLKLANVCSHESTLIFCNQKAMVNQLSKRFKQQHIPHGTFHGDLEQNEREVSLMKLKNGSYNILITTDLAARGLDIDNIKNVIHYQLPHTEAEYIHRNGRTARMHKSGVVYLLLSEDKAWREYIDEMIDYEELPSTIPPTFIPQWQTLYVSAGKKDKINKIDLVGTFLKKGGLQKDELGLIFVKDNKSYVAVPKHKTKELIALLDRQKIKRKKVRIAIAR